MAIGITVGLCPSQAVAGSSYGDPPGWCTNHSDMWTATVVTNDPLVGTNPERDTFYGFRPNPGYDDWYGYFYGDFRGKAGDASGWVRLVHEDYPGHYSWNFASNGWAVTGTPGHKTRTTTGPSAASAGSAAIGAGRRRHTWRTNTAVPSSTSTSTWCRLRRRGRECRACQPTRSPSPGTRSSTPAMARGPTTSPPGWTTTHHG